MVLPFGIYRRFEWNDDHAMLDPAPRYFPDQVITDDALEVAERHRGRREPDGSGIAAPRTTPTGSSGSCADEDIRWVLVEKGTRGDEVPPLRRGPVVHDGAELRLVDLGNPASRPGRVRGLILGVDLAVFGGSVARVRSR